MRFPVTILTVFVAVLPLLFVPVSAAQDHGHMTAAQSEQFQRDQALEISRAVLGSPLSEHYFQDTKGNRVALSSYRGKPLVISMIFTSCFHICPTTTRHLDTVVKKARDALGDDSFNVVTIGFDTVKDTPPMMAQFARQQRVDDPNWQFLSTDQKTVVQLARELGFLYFASGNGFDHLIQTSIIAPDGRVHQQVYGLAFDAPLLIEPLKRFVFNTSETTGLLQSISMQVRLFCTVYDPASDHYRFDYSLFIGMFIGFMCVGVLGVSLVREWRKTLRTRRAEA